MRMDTKTNLAQISPALMSKKLEHWQKHSMNFPEMEGFPAGPPKRAAVLVPFVQKQDGWHVMYIRRSQREGDRHSGQVAFPGGKVELDDHSIETAALRESWEEIGLPPENVELVGRLQNLTTITNFLVTPVVGIVKKPFKTTPSALEVARVFTMPLAWLSDQNNHIIPGVNADAEVEVPGYYRKVNSAHFVPFDGELLWGATARMTFHLIKLLQDKTDHSEAR